MGEFKLDPNTVVALITLAGVIVTALIANRTKRHANAISDAVNHAELGDKPLLQIVKDIATEVGELSKWRRRWQQLPPDLNSAGALAGKLENIEVKVDEAQARIRRVHDDLAAHVAWEMAQKWPLRPRGDEGEER